MQTTQGTHPGSTPRIEADDLLELTLDRARDYDRPDLVNRLNKMRGQLEELPGQVGDREAGEIVARAALRALDSLDTDLEARHATLSDPAYSARLRAELADVRARSEHLAGGMRTWRAAFDHAAAALESNLQFQLRTRPGTVLADAEQAINSHDPAKDEAVLAGWLRERLTFEADAAYRLLHTEVHRLAAEMAGQLGLPAPYQVAPARVLPPDVLVGALAQRPLRAQGGGRRLSARRADALAAVRATVDEFLHMLHGQLTGARYALLSELHGATAAESAARFAAVAAELTSIGAATGLAADGPAAIAEQRAAIAALRARAVALLPEDPRERAPRVLGFRTIMPASSTGVEGYRAERHPAAA
ncbi:MAG TPA: hypothetical protein VH008_15650 [Pseudonocardia sp.]|nr:hypothetical protein [Pseudonocardia sp.]